MSEEPAKHEEDEDEEQQQSEEKSTAMNRKEKRKEMKKKKRREKRRELAEKEREEEEAKLNDPEELKKMELREEEERLRMEKEMIEFEERERIWLEKIRKEDEEEEERRRKKALDDLDAIEADDNEDGSDWEYVEEGPAEIIWKGNEIIVKKKKIRVPKTKVDQQLVEKEVDRPTSNPLPPQSEAFTHYNNASKLSAPDVYENVALQVPNFGTEQDKSHCPFHIKTGACRFGKRCSRVHFYPDKSCTLLIKNMYNGPGLAWEQDEGLECTDEEVERSYEEFYEDVHTEFLKFGEIVNFKVCKNGSFHLRGNVYVHFKSLESAMLAYQYINGRFFAGKQLTCEYVGVTKWKIAICGEYMKSRLKTCSRGTACNFIHCFRNPGGDYEWADWDKPPPRFWIEKMTSLFGYSDDALMESESGGRSRSSRRISPADESRHPSRRSKSRERDRLSNGSGRRLHMKSDEHGSAYYKKHRSDERKERTREEKNCEHETNINDDLLHKVEVQDTDSDRYSCQRDSDRYNGHEKRRSRHRSRTREADSDEYVADLDMERDTNHGQTRERSKHRSRTREADSDKYIAELGTERDAYGRTRESSRHRSRTRQAGSDEYVAALDMERDTRHGRTRESSRHRRRTREADSDEYEADLDKKRDTRYSQTRESSRHRNKENSARSRKTSIDPDSDGKNLSPQKEEVFELSDDYGDNKNMNAESDTDRDISHERLKETRHEHTRKSTKRSHGDSRNVCGGTRKRDRNTDSGGDGSDRENGSKKHHHHNRKSSTRQDDHGKTRKKTDWDEI